MVVVNTIISENSERHVWCARSTVTDSFIESVYQSSIVRGPADGKNHHLGFGRIEDDFFPAGRWQNRQMAEPEFTEKSPQAL